MIIIIIIIAIILNNDPSPLKFSVLWVIFIFFGTDACVFVCAFVDSNIRVLPMNHLVVLYSYLLLLCTFLIFFVLVC